MAHCSPRVSNAHRISVEDLAAVGLHDPARHPSLILPLHSFDMTRVDDVLDEASDLNAQQLYAGALLCQCS